MQKLRVMLLALLLVPAISQAKTLEDLLVEKGVITKGEASSAAAASGAKVYWNGGTRVDFPDQGFTTQINTLIQSRYTFTDGDETAGGTNTSSFDLHNARIIIQGNALHNEFAYYLAPEFAGSDKHGTNSARLWDAYISWKSCDWFTLSMGQWKTGISRQYVASDWSKQFVNDSLVSDQFNLGRQAGLKGSTTWMDGKVGLDAAMYNGESAGEGTNTAGLDKKHTAVVNLRWDAMGTMNTKEEGDIDWSDDAALNLGVAYAYSDIGSGTAAGDISKNTIDFDVNFKYQGWGAHGEYYVADVDPDTGDSVTPQGFYAQVGYFVDPKTLELAVQYGLLDCDNGTATGGACNSGGVDKVNHVQVGLNYFWWRHNLKAQFGYDFRNTSPVSGEDVNTNRWIMQLSSYF